MAVRLIDANRFGKILERWKNDCLEDNDTQGADIIADVILELDDMPTLTPSSEWVSVEERLPGAYKQVLMWSAKWRIIEAGSYYNGHFWVHNELGDGYIAENITYWMILPAPPARRPPKEEMKDASN